MALIDHCRKFKPAVLYFISDVMGLQRVYLYEGKCPVCLKTVYAWFGRDIWNKRFPESGLQIVSKKESSRWIRYIQDGEAVQIEQLPKNPPKDTRGKMLVGEGTLLMSRSVEAVYKRILWAASIKDEAAASDLKAF